MPLPSTAATVASSSDSETAPFTPPDRSGPGRPSSYDPEILAAICTRIRVEGVSDSAAGYLSGVTSSTLSRWKQQSEDVDLALGRARAQFDLACLREIRTARKRDGTPDWRALAWLLRNSSPEGYGPSSRRRKATEPAPETTPPSPACAERSFEEFEALILAEMHRAQAAEARAAAEKAAILPEIHQPETDAALATGVAHEKTVAHAATRVTGQVANLPEIHRHEAPQNPNVHGPQQATRRAGA